MKTLFTLYADKNEEPQTIKVYAQSPTKAFTLARRRGYHVIAYRKAKAKRSPQTQERKCN